MATTSHEKRRCLVTGGAGFIGSHVVDLLLAQGHAVCVLDNMSTGKRRHVPSTVPLYELDINDDLAFLFERERPEYVFHHAAQVSVSASVKEPEKDVRDNLLGMVHLLEACRRHGVKRVIYASSGASYGEPISLPLREEGRTCPLSPYGISKWMGESYLYYYRHQYGLEYVALRYANVFGPRQDPHGEAGVVAIFTKKLLSGEAATIFGDGEQTRDFVFVKDVARANEMAMNTDLTPGLFPVFNVSTQTQVTVNALYAILRRQCASSLDPQYGPKRGGDVYHASLANEKIRTGMGWKPQVSLEAGIRETVEYFKAMAGAADGSATV